jgi:hypothetical protein
LRERPILSLFLLALLLAVGAQASLGDRSQEFRECLQVCADENCGPTSDPTPIPFHRRLLLWDCPSECDYTCQHIVTARRVARREPIVQFHGKWPFHRFMGMQEPFSVLCSLGNLWAHYYGLRKIRTHIPPTYTLRPFYEWLAGVGIASWVFSSIFHTRDFQLTEELDYFAAGASVLYGLYYTPVRIWRLDKNSPRQQSILRAWTLLCGFLYLCHVGYLKFVRWNYTYNMAANVAAGIVQNVLWSYFSIDKYRRSRQSWAIWPGLVVAWVIFAMSMELFDFAPWLGAIDAHSLWHLMTIAPTVLWYNFLIRDARDDIATIRAKT